MDEHELRGWGGNEHWRLGKPGVGCDTDTIARDAGLRIITRLSGLGRKQVPRTYWSISDRIRLFMRAVADIQVLHGHSACSIISASNQFNGRSMEKIPLTGSIH